MCARGSLYGAAIEVFLLLRFFQQLFLLSLPLRRYLQGMFTATFYGFIVDECFFFLTTET